jgi:hypothetical protein
MRLSPRKFGVARVFAPDGAQPSTAAVHPLVSAPSCRRARAILSPLFMDNPAIDRLDAAITRVERVLEQRLAAAATLARRHEALREKMGEAVAALDEIIARGGQD